MQRAPRRFRRVSKAVSALVCLSLLSPSPWVATAFASGLPLALSAGARHPVAMVDELGRMLAPDAGAPAGSIMGLARELQKTCGNDKVVSLWVESILGGPLAGLPETAVPSKSMLGPARESLPVLRRMLERGAFKNGEFQVPALGAVSIGGSNPGLATADSRIQSLLATLPPAQLPKDGVDAGALPGRTQPGLKPSAGPEPQVGDPSERELRDEVRRAREELAVAERLSQRSDLTDPLAKDKASELRRLDEMLKGYQGVLDGPSDAPGLRESAELRQAALGALRRLLADFKSPKLPETGPQPGRPLTEEEKKIAASLDRLDALKGSAQSGVAERDAAAAGLGVADKVRTGALRDRRSGKEMMEFRKNFARLAMVMDLSYSLNILNSAENALAGMLDLLDKKLKKIEHQRGNNDQSSAAAAALRAKRDAWIKSLDATMAENKKNMDDFASLSTKTGRLSMRVSEFKAGVPALLAMIDARDKGRSANAVAEYNRRLAVLPAVMQKLTSGSGSNNGKIEISLDYLKKQSADVNGYLDKLKNAVEQIDSTPLEFAGVMVLLVPGIPEISVNSPSAQQVLDILAQRKAYWQDMLDDHLEVLASVNGYLDPGNAKRVTDDFGDSVPESLVVYQAEERARSNRAKALLAELAGKADEIAARMSALGASVPTLSGKTPSDYRGILETYVDQVMALSFPDTDDGFAAKVDKLSLANILVYMADATAVALEADCKVSILGRAVTDIVPKAKARFEDSTNTMRAVLQDVDMDIAFVNAGFPRAQLESVIARKRLLVGTTLKGMLQRMQAFLDQTVIPFWTERITTTDPNYQGDSLALLYREKAKLYTDKIKKALERTVPWALASDGAPEGNVGQAVSNIARLKDTFKKYLDLVADLKDTIRRRLDPNGVETEDVYGEQAPFSFIVRAKKYRQEKINKAAALNAVAAEINGILGEMDAIAPANGLAAKYSLPTDIAGDGAESAARLRKMGDDRVLQNMADAIRKIAEDAQAAAGSTNLNVGGSGGTIPTGTQPPLEIDKNLKLALLGLEAVKRLVPTQNTGGNSFAESLARYLFADALVVTSEQYINERIPIFSAFLDKGQLVLNELFADFDADTAWVNGDLSGGTAVLDRKARLYAKVSDTAKEGSGLFGQKSSWDTETYGTIDTASLYYDTMGEVYEYGNQALDKDADSVKTMKDAVQKKLDAIREQKTTVVNWLSQLNDPHESALNRVSQNVSAIQEKTRAVVEANLSWHESDAAYKLANKRLSETLEAMAREQAEFFKLIEKVGDISSLEPALAGRVSEVVRQGTSWLAAAPGGPQTIVIPKTGFSSFLGTLFSSFEPESSARDIVALREEILKNPMALSQLLPNSKMIEVGEGANGFYLVYQTEFSTPYGLETTNAVTFGNVARLWNSNVSLQGYKFASPPSDVNAPFGDQGLSLQVETLDNKNFVNYLDITFHKFIQDIPSDITVADQVGEARMMIFDDFALLLANGKVYFGAAGFADFALSNTAEKPYYYGGNFKASVKFTEVLSLNAEEQLLFAKDPRKFLQTVNLDFTKLDPDLDHDFVIAGEGEEKSYRRDQVGVGADLQKALKTKDSFKLDLYFARVSGTDDFNQDLVGATVLKGFSFDVGGTPVNVNVGGGAEFGTEYNNYNGKISFELPNQGLVLSATGKIIGDAETYFLEVRKKLGGNTEAFASYGSRYIGLNHRLTIGMNTSFTLGELWRGATRDAADALNGGEALKGFDGKLEEFFKRDDPGNPVLAELKRVFDADVGKKLLTLDIGRLSQDLAELRKAGAILDNTRVSAMLGFVTNAVSPDAAERASTGGFQVGTRMDYTMSKSQRALIENRIASIFSEAVRLQIRLLELAKAWQVALADMVQTRWEAALAQHMAALAPDAQLKAEAKSQFLDAQARHRQAALRYNALTGRGPDDAVFFDLNPQDMDRMMFVLEKALSSPRRLSALVESLRDVNLPRESFNLMDWIPWLEKLTFYVGAQLTDNLSSQILGAGVSITLPIYDPASKAADRGLVLENQAVILEMTQALGNAGLRAQSEKAESMALDARLNGLQGKGKDLSQAVWDGIRGYRNGLVEQGELWDRVRRWRWSLATEMESRAQSAMKAAWSIMDFALARTARPRGGSEWRGSVGQPAGLEEGLALAQKNSLTIEALALRSQAARELVEASSHRFSKVAVDLNVGVNITAAGVAWIPAFGITGLAIFPIFNVDLRPEELETLSVKRHEAERGLYTRLKDKVSGDIALQLFEAYTAYKSLSEIIAIYERELIPRLQFGAGTSDDWTLDRAVAELAELKGKQAQSLSLLNYLMGRPLALPLDMNEGFDSALAKLGETFAKQSPVEASLDVLRSRLAVAQATETIVDKNLKVQNIRFDPISLIGRSLGRLINALSGNGLASPEAVAVARYQTLACEADLAAFEKSLGAMRSKIAYELARVERQLAELQGRTDPASRIRLASLRSRLYSLKAAALFFGAGASSQPGTASLPSSYGELQTRLEEAFGKETYTKQDFASSRITPGESPIDAQGNLRYYYLKQSLAKEPIGKHLVEGWVEVRLRSASTPPEALIALAGLQKDRADQLFRTDQAAAMAKAQILLSRIGLYKGLLKGNLTDQASRELRERLDRDVAEVAAHLGLGASVPAAQILALVPEDGVKGPEDAARLYLSSVAELDLNHLRRTLFSQGLPGQLQGSSDPLLQLKANLIAEKMSYKGFTPLAAFGMFRGSWVGAFMLEAPNPEAIQKGLQNILTDALRKELESQERLRTLGLKLHQLMASVADKVRLLDAQRERLLLARRGLAGMLERRRLGMASEADVLASSREAAATHEDFVDLVSALQADFVVLVTELEALGLGDRSGGAPRLIPPHDDPQVLERSAMEKLMSFVSERFLDEDFEKRIGDLLAGAPPRLREELRKNIEEYRKAKQADGWVRYDSFTPAERIDLLTKVDLQGRREKVERSFQLILDELARGQGPYWQKVMAFLGAEVESQEAAAGLAVRDGAEMRGVLRQAYWEAVPAPAKVDEIYKSLSALSAAVDAARVRALEMYLAGAEKPEDYVLRDARLYEYVKALAAYDEAVVKAYAGGELASRPEWAKSLNALFSLQASAERRRDLLRYGRGIMTIDAAIGLAEGRLVALRAGPDDYREIAPAAESISFLKAMRERWISKPSEIESLLYVAPAKEGDEPLWLTEAELGRDNRRVVEVGGRRYLLPGTFVGKDPGTVDEVRKANGREIVAGKDAESDRLRKAAEEAETLRRRRVLDDSLSKAELALTSDAWGRTGLLTGTISLEKLRRLEREGRVFYFSARPDRSRRRAYIHPVAALSKSPADLVIMVHVRGPNLPADKFSCLEDLESSPWKSEFEKVEFGSLGVAALINEAREAELAATRGGWLSLKLEGYAFAMADNAVVEVFVNDEDYQKAVEKAKDPKEPSSKWTFHKVSDLSIGLDSEDRVVGARGQGFDLKLGDAPAVRWLSQELYALETDSTGRVIKAYTDESSLRSDSSTWWLEDMAGNVYKKTDESISPTHRLKRYIDPSTNLSVSLGRSILARRLDEAEDEKGDVGRWAYMPWNWPNIVLELPRGIVKVPIEMITGRDPNQEGYIGRVYMYQTEGGATQRYGVVGTVLRVIDVFEILPDPVQRYYDPSQFPELVNNSSPLLPGQWEHEKSPQTTDGGRNIHFGAGFMEREIRWATEDQRDSRGRILASFSGGVRRNFVENVRGRAGTYVDSRIDNLPGMIPAQEVLRRSGATTDADGRAVIDERPDHIAVERVTAEIEIRLGASQHQERQRIYQEYLKAIEAKRRELNASPKSESSARQLSALDSARRSLEVAVHAAAPWQGYPAPVPPMLLNGPLALAGLK